MKVFVYFNLHKKLFSVKALEGPNKGRVVAHRRELSLRHVIFKVSEAGRQRVLQEKRKNVHAGVVGYWNDVNDIVDNEIEVTYNPYKYESFVFKYNEQPIKQAHDAYLVDKQIFV
jgi:hypothetical protein